MHEVLRYDSVCFDFDGSLADTLHEWAEAIQAVLAERNIFPTQEQTIDIMADLGNAVKYGYPDKDGFIVKVLEIMHSRIDKIRLYDHILETLEELRKMGVSLAIVTSATEYWVRSIAENTGIIKLVGVIAYRGHKEIKHTKPHPSPIYWALEQMGRDRSGTAMIGDGWVDIKAAKNAEVEPWVAYYGRNNEYQPESVIVGWGATHIVTDPKQLIGLVMGRG